MSRYKHVHVYAMKAYRSRGIAQLILKLSSRREWLTSRPGHCTPGERPSVAHRIEGWVDPTAGLDYWGTEKKNLLPILGTEARIVYPVPWYTCVILYLNTN